MQTFRRLLTAGLLLGTALPAHADFLYERAARAAKAGDLSTAIVYIDGALAREPAEPSDMLALLKRVRDSYYERWVSQQIAKVGAITDTNAETAFGVLAAIKAQAAGATIDGTELDAALARATQLLTARVAQLESAGDLGHAEVLLAAIAKLVPAKEPELAQLRARAFAARTSEAQAAAGHPGARLLHLALAARFGSVPADELAAARAAVAARTELQVSATVAGTCLGEETKLARSAAAGPGLAVQLAIEVYDCSLTGPTETSGTESVAYDNVEVQLVPRSHMATAGFSCGTHFNDQSGQTFEVHSDTQQPGCRTPNYVEVSDPPERRELRTPAKEDVDVTFTTFTASGKVHVVATWPGETASDGAQVEGSSVGKHWAAPAHAARPPDKGTATAAEATSELGASLQKAAWSIVDTVRRKLAAAAKASAAGGAGLAAEDELVVAALLEKTVSSELGQLATTQYHTSGDEVASALFDKPYEVADLHAALLLPSISDDDDRDDRRTRSAVFFNTATGRSAFAYNVSAGYQRATAAGKAENGTVLAALDFFLSYPVLGPLAIAGLFDFRAGNGGYADTRFLVGGGVNLHGVLIEPMAGAGFDKLGTPDEATQPNLQFNIAMEAELALRLGVAIPHVLALDATLARRRRIDTDLAVENRVDLSLRIRPVVVSLSYTQLSDDTGDYFGGLALAHEKAQLLQILVGGGY